MKGLAEHGHMRMPWIENSLASYLSPGAASSWKAPVLPSKPCQTTSRLVGKACVAMGQAGGALHYVGVARLPGRLVKGS